MVMVVSMISKAVEGKENLFIMLIFSRRDEISRSNGVAAGKLRLLQSSLNLIVSAKKDEVGGFRGIRMVEV